MIVFALTEFRINTSKKDARKEDARILKLFKNKEDARIEAVRLNSIEEKDCYSTFRYGVSTEEVF